MLCLLLAAGMTYGGQPVFLATGGDSKLNYAHYPGTSSQTVYGVHIFTTVGAATFTSLTRLNVEYLVVAGGGGGGGTSDGGGGGAGGYLEGTTNVSIGNVSVVVGAGGAGASGGGAGLNGGDSSFGITVAKGGGFGGDPGSPSAGGSGGGATAWRGSSSVVGGAGTSGQGYKGGDNLGGQTAALAGAGGGGAGAEGTPVPVDPGGVKTFAGGAGKSSSIRTDSPSTYARGGNGHSRGFGGNGANGDANTGNGGDGCGGASTGGAGGSGIVVLRYVIPPAGTVLVLR